jgi:hypothetical protein
MRNREIKSFLSGQLASGRSQDATGDLLLSRPLRYPQRSVFGWVTCLGWSAVPDINTI